MRSVIAEFNALVRLHRYFGTHPLARDDRLKAWMGFLRWQVESRMQREVIVPWVGGRKLALRNGMRGATANAYVGLQEFTDMMFLLHFLRNDDLFLDVGANVGSFTVLAAGICGARTWAFEPAAETVGYLIRNVELNALQDRVVVHRVALAEASGETRFTQGLDHLNRIAAVTDQHIQIVRQEALDNLIGGNAPAMLKADVEGFEEAVLRGAQTVLAKPSLQAIELETVTPWIERTLAKHGFEHAYYDPLHRKLGRRLVEQSHNLLFVRDFDFVGARLASAPPVEVMGRAF